MEPLETRRRARVVASFAEYLAEHDYRDPDRAVEAMTALADWCDGDRELLAQARAEVRGDTRRAQRVQEAVAENNQYAEQLLAFADQGAAP